MRHLYLVAEQLHKVRFHICLRNQQSRDLPLKHIIGVDLVAVLDQRADGCVQQIGGVCAPDVVERRRIDHHERLEKRLVFRIPRAAVTQRRHFVHCQMHRFVDTKRGKQQQDKPQHKRAGSPGFARFLFFRHTSLLTAPGRNRAQYIFPLSVYPVPRGLWRAVSAWRSRSRRRSRIHRRR